jgi:hypothetical protein
VPATLQLLYNMFFLARINVHCIGFVFVQGILGEIALSINSISPYFLSQSVILSYHHRNLLINLTKKIEMLSFLWLCYLSMRALERGETRTVS